MTLSEGKRKVLLAVVTAACGTLGFVLLMWTPATGKGILIYVVLLAVLIVMAIALSSRRKGERWPHKSQHH